MGADVPSKRGKSMPLESADNKVREICAILRKETLEPAQDEVKRILSNAEKEADEMIRRAKEEVLKIREENKKDLANELKAHEGSIQLAIKQGISTLRQGVEKIFAQELGSEIEKVMVKEDAIARAIEVVFSLLEKEGMKLDLRAMLPKHVDITAICNKLTHDFGERVKKDAIQIEDIKGGALIKLKEKKMSIDITDAAIRELLASYVIPELREKIFCEG